MKLYDPAVVRGHGGGRGRSGRVGPIRSIEVRVLHPSSERQLAHARLLPPPTDIPPGRIAPARRPRRIGCRPSALGPAAATLGRLYSNIVLGSIVHELALIRAFAGDPIGDRCRRCLAGRASGHRRSRSTAGSPATRVSPSAGTSCPTTRPTARRSGSSPSGPPSSWSSLRHTCSTPRPSCGSRELAGDGRRDTRFRSVAEAFEEELLAFHAPGRGRDRAAGRHRRGPRGHRHLASGSSPGAPEQTGPARSRIEAPG